jgi:acyl-CoA thioesterase I
MYFASGESFYLGAGLLLLVIATSSWPPRRTSFWLRRLAIWLGVALIVVACPPFPLMVDAGLAAAFLRWLFFLNGISQRWHWLRIAATCTLIVYLSALSTSEWYQRKLPVIRARPGDDLVVLGDSISAGLGGNVQPWPEVMQRMSGFRVKNLSKPGAIMADGTAMANQVAADDRLILIELGGNDLLAGEPAGEFSRKLESLLQRLSAPERTLIMFELPLIPQATPYGQVQRRLAKKYGVVLIPKRYFAGIISGKEATSDGLHLTKVGADRMASLVARILRPDARAESRRYSSRHTSLNS